MRGLGLIIYGVEGIGKSEFSLQFPKPLRCISVNETGFEDLVDIGAVPEQCENVNAQSWADLMTEFRQSTDVRTIIIDSLSGVSQMMKDDIIKTVYSRAENPLQAFGSFSEGWRIHAPIWAEKIEVAANLLRHKGINVILIGHTKIEKSKNIVSTDYQSASLNMESWPRDVLTKWAQAVLFMTMDFQIRVTKSWKGAATEAKVVGDLEDEVDRIIYTTKHPSHSAKNRLNLPPFIPMGESASEAYSNFVSKLPDNFQQALKN
jgi:hypothetical protein